MDRLQLYKGYDSVHGNMSSRVVGTDLTTFEYDDYNLLKRIEWPDDSISEFLSDAAGNRISMTTSDDNDFTFIYDTTAGIPAVLMEYVYNTIPRLYVRTPDGRLIAACGISSGTAYLNSYYHFDGLGSTRALTNSEGTVTDRYTYDVWGNVTRTYGETQQPYMFVGQLGYYTHHSYYDKLNPFSTESDKYVLLQLGVRYYQPGMGRFTQRDPVRRHHMTAYSYIDDAPLSAVDPTGREFGPPIYRNPGPVSRVKICYRNLGCDLRHVYLLIDGMPIGYGPWGVGQNKDDIDDLKQGQASCSSLTVTDAQHACLRRVFYDYIRGRQPGIPGNWGPGWQARGGSYCPLTNNCYHWANAALAHCGVSHSIPEPYPWWILRPDPYYCPA